MSTGLMYLSGDAVTGLLSVVDCDHDAHVASSAAKFLSTSALDGVWIILIWGWW